MVATEIIEAQPTRIKRFTTHEYEELIAGGYLDTSDKVELLDGYLVEKTPHDARHSTLVDIVQELLRALMPATWTTRSQLPVRLLGDNLPEPDVAIVMGPKKRYFEDHPTANDVAMIVEVSNTTLDNDRGTKLIEYARSGIAIYWVINIPDCRVEVYSEPKGGRKPAYKTLVEYGPGERVPVVIAGKLIGEIPASELLPV
jgi:Uma2 family endonuclease